jgi:TetR/AcrR family acrAB operon transcriptional repressor
MPRKPAHEQFDTLQAIRDEAFALFGRYGYDGVSIGDIAKAAKLTKGALYWHFQGKDELYLECLKRLHSIFDQYIFDPMRAEQQSVPRIMALFSGLAQMLRDPRVAQGVAGYWLVPSARDNFLQAHRRFEESSRATVTETLRLGVEQGRFNFGDDLEDMARAIILFVEALVLPLRHLKPQDVSRMMGVYARTLFRAYASADDLLALTRAL